MKVNYIIIIEWLAIVIKNELKPLIYELPYPVGSLGYSNQVLKNRRLFGIFKRVSGLQKTRRFIILLYPLLLEYPLLSLPVFLLLWLTVSVTIGCLSAVRVAAVGIEALTVIVEAPIESAAHSSLEELVLEYPLAARKDGVAIE